MTIKIKLRSLLLEMEIKRYHVELRDVSANAVNALAEHCLDLIGIGFLDCLKVDEGSIGDCSICSFPLSYWDIKNEVARGLTSLA
ncbi:hypothetical protein POTOM_045349 [Populus tomentosa]|uniref:Uncharacterized protein n=1 Tax=Populus tomentosa TaxID=118781 RepID=A0A8X8CF70_POPTO|nr:hypothetical protein POTOM_045349 [Populus tomentosa]